MARLTVRVTPRAGRDGIDGFDEAGALRVRVRAAPADGAANAAVAALLAKALGLPGRQVALVQGAASRVKVFEVGLPLEEAAARLGAGIEPAGKAGPR
ncbi:MAG: hypothetical protein KatS3mg064_0797 [Tepidiforma sp.]|nr:DUF167 family protein [Tepidiforma sp.]GIW17640.1 MAG: hypothetical protein KatS3mg064_0797 [Tepidiforma sp.]